MDKDSLLVDAQTLAKRRDRTLSAIAETILPHRYADGCDDANNALERVANILTEQGYLEPLEDPYASA